MITPSISGCQPPWHFTLSDKIFIYLYYCLCFFDYVFSVCSTITGSNIYASYIVSQSFSYRCKCLFNSILAQLFLQTLFMASTGSMGTLIAMTGYFTNISGKRQWFSSTDTITNLTATNLTSTTTTGSTLSIPFFN